MQVVKRSGQRETVSFDKITERLRAHCTDLAVDPIPIAQETIRGLYDGIPTSKLDLLSADICASKIQHHPDYNKLASRILISNLHKTTSPSLLEVTRRIQSKNLLSPDYVQFIEDNHSKLQEMLDFERDYRYDVFGFKTLERGYLLKVDGQVVERPAHLWMRVAIQIHSPDLLKIMTTYDGLSQGYFTHATPTLFNSGLKTAQLSSCFLLNTSDNIPQMYKTVSDIASISKHAGGIGLTLSNIRARGSLIHSSLGEAQGLIPYCRVLQDVGRHVNQSSKRMGSIACYLEPWHADVFDFIELRKNTGDENLRCRDLFLALWVPDLFMKRVEADEVWSLMCPDQCPGLTVTYGDEFETLYLDYESQGQYVRQVRARDLWKKILESQIETGMPYMSYKDHVNRKNNQKNLGTIQCSNLCNEIVIYSSPEEYGTCNLASICLPRFVEDGVFNYETLGEIVEMITENLNNVIDRNYYPTPETRKSNIRNRPIGIGVQGLSDVYTLLGFAFESQEARDVNKRIFETIYYHAVKKSCELSQRDGSYYSFDSSPMSQGQFQFDLWGLDRKTLSLGEKWSGLEKEVKKWGVRNSLLTALMPTASTAQIMGNTECFEPPTSNLYVRKTLAGEYVIVNERLVRSLIEKGLWNREIYDQILFYNGSIQRIQEIPESIKKLYKTAYEIKQSEIVRQSAERGPFIDQTQSMNLFMASPDFQKLGSAHFAGWRQGLKTGMYYLRTQPAVDPIKFGLDPGVVQKLKRRDQEHHGHSSGHHEKKAEARAEPKSEVQVEGPACVFVRRGEPIPEGCEVCGS